MGQIKLDFSTGSIVASLIWGSIGTGFAVYGWKQKDTAPLLGGIALIAISYFIGSALWMSLAGMALAAGTIWLRRYL